jgi:hypothetical protein
VKFPLHIPSTKLVALQSIRWMDENQQASLACVYDGVSQGFEDEYFSASKAMGLVHTLGAVARHCCGIEAHPAYRAYSRLASMVYSVQRDCWLKVQSELNSRGISVLIFKGLLFIDQIYRNSNHYLMNDIDCLVHQSDLQGVRDALEHIGYSQRIVSNCGIIQTVSEDLIGDFESKHYELFPYTLIVEVPALVELIADIGKYVSGHPFIIEEGRCYLAIEIDVHHNLSHGFDENDIWDSPKVFTLGELDVSAPNLNVMGWFLPARFYHEVMVLADKKAKLLADLAGLVATESIDYDVVLKMASRYTLESSLWYVYRFLREELDFGVPIDFLESLRENGRNKPQYRDWGDFLPKLIGESVTYSLSRTRSDRDVNSL